MKLTKNILKNRKAMTPLMIGIIVAASVIAVIFVVMAGVITVLPHDITMTIREGSVKGKNTNHLRLEFQVQCENENGTVYRIDITHDGVLYGHKYTNIQIGYRYTETIAVDYFDADDAPLAEKDGLKLLFVPDQVYVLTVHFYNLEGNNAGSVSLSFIYNIPS